MQHLHKTIAALKRGDVVLVPTDTNYALAADLWNIEACKKIYDLKKRDSQKPLTLFISEPEQAWDYIAVSKVRHRDALKKLIAAMPGPLNLVVPASENVPVNPYLKLNSISLVCNQQRALRDLIRLHGRPLGMSSANLSGIESDRLIDIETARLTFGDSVGYILPASQPPETTVSSTIVSLLGDEIQTLRKGDVDIAAILS
ncbi:L-threonylcarbamoyladenylate synthase [Tenebrionicola larvae]|uniref:L-threonylcarbamoyladenylate synthase n=3 Tax=Tenebrionibacter/Tenebrionicola group TaxID=2969848 RepID=A0A8K0V792_9ENTR|nr:L-threonylcarbamoyladenylate synthase [Tenebrionicola larvae]MBK4716653.1 L-threonylcarbamoyladenylate synthase [Tenebrionibacter intestinalis]MBV5097327.1 L-threonylcarbamoyladenylate synthase [Tenebrionicola larvae]